MMIGMAQISAQSTQIHSKSSDLTTYHAEISKQFKNYKLVTLDVASLIAELEDFDAVKNISLKIDDNETWPMELVPQTTLVNSMKITLASGEDLTDDIHVYPYAGNILNANSSDVRLTVAEDFVYGYIQDPEFNRFIEPLHTVIKTAPKGLYLVYDGDDVIFPEESVCASSHTAAKTKEMEGSMKSVGLCFEVEVSVASDWLMFDSYNEDVAALTAHNVGVMNNVQNNYDDEFDDEIFFVLVEQWISNCSTCDPWTNSTAAGTLLNSFRSWGPSGFNQTHDVGQLWTNRNLDGSTIGIAFVGVVCTGSRYQVLEDFSNNANLKRVMVAHELGHNFDAVQSATGHDAVGSPFIMAPTVQNTATWSVASIGDIEAHYLSRTCLAACAPPAPPVADFFANLTDICPGTTIQFFDNSSASPTSWNWTFTGGTPGSSTLENPMVTYNTNGTYSVSMTATNASGSNTVTKNAYITVGAGGTEILIADDFSGGLANWNVTNPDNSTTWQTISVPGSTGSNNGAWIDNYNYSDGSGDFDGLESGVLDFAGRSSIQLQLEYAYARYNAGNSDIFRVKVSTNGGATFPNTIFTGQENGTGNFATVSDQTSAFTPENATQWCVSTPTNADCLDLNLDQFIGETNVVIRLENESDFGNNLYLDNVLLTSSCQVIAPPATQFTSDVTSGCAPLIVQYQDLSTNGPTSWNWTFPGGTPASSTQQNPTVVYNNKGQYDATLVASNSAGSNTFSLNNYIDVMDVPIAGFSQSADGQTVFFANTSIDGTFYSWNFGDNESSTDPNPVHQYDEDGTYTVVLIAGNACGTDEFSFTIEVASAPIAGFGQDFTSGCVPLIVSFVDQSSPNTDSYLWTFEGGVPATSTLANPVVSYENKGVYDVTLVVTNETGTDEIVMADHIIVSDIPEADFTSFADGFVVDFTNSTVDGTSYMWDFGDTGTSDLENPSHTYASDGIFTVTLTATNACGDHVVTYDVNISNLPSAAFSSNVTAGCTALTVQFEDNSSSNVDSWLWSFEGGNPATSTLQNPEVVYETAGVYDVELIVTNEEGNDFITLTDYVTVTTGPSAGFSQTNDQLTYSFMNSSSNEDSYTWDFGDTNTSNEENPTHIYDEDGMYTVILVVSNACGTSEFSMLVNVVSSVTAGFSANSTAGCADLVVEYSDNSTSNATSWMWNFPGGNPSSSTDQNPTVTYSQAGTYDASLMVANAEYSDDISFTNYISVTDIPNADFNFDISMLNVDFTNSTVNGVSYFWDFGDNTTSVLDSPEHVYDAEGIYQVMLIATNSCGPDTTIIEVNVSALPTANFSSNVQAGCADFTVNYTDLSTSNTTEWLWTFEGGEPSTSTDQNPTISYSTAGVFDVTLLARNATGEDEYVLTDYISVSTTPVVTVDQTMNGNAVDFDATSGNTDSYEWTVGGLTDVYDIANPTIVFPADGVYSITMKATNECGTSTSTFAVNITAYPNASFENNITTGCNPLVVDYSDTSTDEVSGWMWEFEGGTPAMSVEADPSIIYNTPGTYSVRLIVSNTYGNDTVDMADLIIVEAKPVADFDFDLMGPNAQFTNNSTGGGTSMWDFGDMNMSDDENPSHLYAEAGSYDVTLVIDNGGNCKDTITKTVITIVDNVADIDDSHINLYPVPSSGQFVLAISDDFSGLVELKITNALGQLIEQSKKSINAGDNKYQFDRDYTSGLYFLSITYDEITYVKRFIIER